MTEEIKQEEVKVDEVKSKLSKKGFYGVEVYSIGRCIQSKRKCIRFFMRVILEVFLFGC